MHLVWTTRDDVTFANSGEYTVPDGTLEIVVELAAADSEYSIDKTKPYAWLIDTTTGEILPYDPLSETVVEIEDETVVDEGNKDGEKPSESADNSEDQGNLPETPESPSELNTERPESEGFTKDNLHDPPANENTRKETEKLSDSATLFASLLAGGTDITLMKRRKKLTPEMET